MSSRGMLPPPRSAAASAAGSTSLSYLLMHDKMGWRSVTSAGTMQEEYLRTYGDLPDVDVPKGTLVEVDPSGDFDPRTNISVNVVSLDDRREVNVSLLIKELLPIEDGVHRRLLPLRPQERWAF